MRFALTGSLLQRHNQVSLVRIPRDQLYGLNHNLSVRSRFWFLVNAIAHKLLGSRRLGEMRDRVEIRVQAIAHLRIIPETILICLAQLGQTFGILAIMVILAELSLGVSIG